MKEKMLRFVCKEGSNLIIKITKQEKRAKDMMLMNEGIFVHSYNIAYYPSVFKLRVGNILNEFEIEKSKVY